MARLTIINRFEEYGVKIEQVVNCGGIAEKNAVVMQIYADVIGRPMKVSRSAQTCALGSAIAGAVVAGRYADYDEAQTRHDRPERARLHARIRKRTPVYQRTLPVYRDLHDAFGTREWNGNLFHVMKKLLDIRDKARN